MAIGSSIRRASLKLSDANNNNYNSTTAADPEYSDELLKSYVKKANIEINYNIENSTDQKMKQPETITEEVSNYNKAIKKFNSLSNTTQLIVILIGIVLFKKLIDKLVISRRPKIYM